MKKLVLLFLSIAAFSALTGCMGPLMHEGHGDYPDRSDYSGGNRGSYGGGHHH